MPAGSVATVPACGLHRTLQYTPLGRPGKRANSGDGSGQARETGAIGAVTLAASSPRSEAAVPAACPGDLPVSKAPLRPSPPAVPDPAQDARAGVAPTPAVRHAAALRQLRMSVSHPRLTTPGRGNGRRSGTAVALPKRGPPRRVLPASCLWLQAAENVALVRIVTVPRHIGRVLAHCQGPRCHATARVPDLVPWVAASAAGS